MMATYLKSLNCSECQKKISIFRFLTDEELKIMNDNRQEVIFNAGEMIFKQGSPLTHIACLIIGMAKIYIEGFNRKNLILKIAQPGEIIVGPGLFVDYKHHFSVTTIEDTMACFIHVDAIRDVITRNPAFALEMLKQVHESDIKCYEKLINLTQKQMHGRVADALLYLSHAVYKSNDFRTVLSRQEMAELSAMTKESVIRIIKEFRDENILQVEGNRFNILQEEALLNISLKG